MYVILKKSIQCNSIYNRKRGKLKENLSKRVEYPYHGL